MTLQDDIMDFLDVLDFPSASDLSLQPETLDDLTFASIVSWLSFETQKCLKLECNVSKIESLDDYSCFQLELGSFLRELNPPFDFKNIQDVDVRYRLINYLCGETIAGRIVYHRENTIKMSESETAKDLKSVVISLSLGKPPASITSEQLFSKVTDKINQLIQSNQLALEEPLLLKKGMQLNLNQWNTLQELEAKLVEEYSLRRQMLITRCDCTVGSFKWKGGEKSSLDEVYNKLRSMLSSKSEVTIAHALAARESDCDTLFNSVVSTDHQTCIILAPDTKGQANAGRQQRLSLHKYLIGYVPDRGGRPTEQQAPQQETFEQQQSVREQQQHRNTGQGQGRGGGGGGGAGSGGRGGQNHFSQKPSRVQGAGWNQGGDRGFDSRQRGYDNANYSNAGYSSHGYQDHQQDFQQGYQQGYHRREESQGYYGQNHNWNQQAVYQQEYRHPADYYQDSNYQNFHNPQERHYQDRSFRRGGGGGGRRNHY